MEDKIKNQIDIINNKIKELNSLYHIAADIIRDIGWGDWYMVRSSPSKGGNSQQDLSELLSLPKQTVNSIISGLTKKGFVYLKHVSGTRNRKVICLTEEGLKYGTNHVKWIFDAEESVLEQTDLK